MVARALPGTRALPLEATLAMQSVLSRILERHAWAAALLGCVASLVVAGLERRHGSLGAADRALGGAAIGLVLPLVACISVGAGLGRGRLNQALEPLSRHGGSPLFASLGALGALALLVALAATLIGVATTLAAGHPGDGLLADASSTGWIFGLAGATYAVCFVAASSFGRRGGGRVWFLLLDFAIGSSSGGFAAFFPRSHLRNLVGGSPPLELPQGASLGALVALALFAGVFAVRRAGTTRVAY